MLPPCRAPITITIRGTPDDNAHEPRTRSRSDHPRVPSHAILGEKVHNLSLIGTSGQSRNVALNFKHLNAFYSYVIGVLVTIV